VTRTATPGRNTAPAGARVARGHTEATPGRTTGPAGAHIARDLRWRNSGRAQCALLQLVIALAGTAQAAETLVSTEAEYQAAVEAARPGDTIVLANGEWRDFEILFSGNGTAEQPITLTAETKGKVTLSGESNLRLAGRHLVVSGLVFRDGHSPTNTVIAFRRTEGDLAYHSRVTEVVIDHYNNPERYETDFWVMLYGRHNRFDHNHLEGKSNQGVTLAVRLDEPESRENHHRIDHNYFGARPVLGSNGGETLRIGTSHYSLSDSLTVVEDNWFEHCDGEVEIVSSKSGGNVFRGNVFFESRGTLTLRHGHGNVVENNVFLGNRVPHTGGIRVINERQVVRNNYLYGLTGHRFGGALVVMNGVPDSPLNRYNQVRDSVIERNSIIDSNHIELAAGSDEERTAPPVDTTFRSNLIYNADGRNIITVHDDVSGIHFEGNVQNEVADPAIGRGFTSRHVELVRAPNGLQYPAGRELAGVGVSRDLEVPDRDATGVDWYPKPEPAARFDSGTVITVPPGEGNLAAALAKAGPGDVLALAPGRHLARRTLVVAHPVTVRSAQPEAPAVMEFERTALFEIADGGSLKLSHLTISGGSAPDRAGNSVVRTSRYSMLGNYVLVVADSTITDLDVNHSFNFFTAAKHTFADRIEISGSSFRNITGHVLDLDKEVDDLGIYDAEYVYIRGSSFENVGGTIANVYRGGTDESTFGPHFELSASTLNGVGRGSRNKTGASVRLLGAQDTDISGNVFVDSAPVRITGTVGEPITRLHDNEYRGTGAPVIDSI
jgi:poly(beta-D-mannuronate) lyase